MKGRRCSLNERKKQKIRPVSRSISTESDNSTGSFLVTSTSAAVEYKSEPETLKAEIFIETISSRQPNEGFDIANKTEKGRRRKPSLPLRFSTSLSQTETSKEPSLCKEFAKKTNGGPSRYRRCRLCFPSLKPQVSPPMIGILTASSLISFYSWDNNVGHLTCRRDQTAGSYPEDFSKHDLESISYVQILKTQFEDEVCRYFQQLINVVEFYHSRGVYHRDLKPENLLLDAYGNIKVSDFGLSALSQQIRDYLAIESFKFEENHRRKSKLFSTLSIPEAFTIPFAAAETFNEVQDKCLNLQDENAAGAGQLKETDNCISVGVILQPKEGSSISSQTISVTKVESDGMATIQDRTILTESTIASTGIMHGSPVSADSSQYSDSGIFLKENATNGDINHFGSMPLDSAVYSDYIVAISALANDPSPRIATLGRRALAIIGIEHVVVSNVAKYNDGSFHQGDLSCQSASSTVGLTRSSSWFDMHTAKLPMTIRTPPVNPSRQDYLTGLRRVCSLEFRPHLVHSQDTGQADPLLGSIVSFGTSERLLPRSSIYKWNREHFSRPLLNASDENEDDLVTREQKEKIALDGIAKCKHSCITQFNNQVASWDTRFETGAKATILLPFSPIVVAADENERIRVWNYEDATQLNSFDNHNSSNRGVSKLCLVNELDDSLLLVASNQGNIRIWKDFTLKGREKLVTAFSSILSHRTGVLASNAVVDWQQQSGYLYASSEISSILLWDLDKEQNISSISSSLESCISALSASQVRGGQIVAGFVDGSVRIFDVRTPDMPVCSTRLHTQKGEKVVGIGFLPGLDLFKIVSASQAGDIQFLDIRNHSEAYLTIDAHRGSLTSLAIHRHAPVIASGSTKQIVKVFSLDGEQRSIIKYYPTLMAQRIGSVNCLNFHPYKALLAVGAADACVSIYADNNYEAR